MGWWQRLKKNRLARFGAILLAIFYLSVIAADFVAPYDPYSSQPDGSLLPPTRIYWHQQGGTNRGKWLGPHVYPTTQSPTDIKTGDRTLQEDFSQPSPLALFVRGNPYYLGKFSLPLPSGLNFPEGKLGLPTVTFSEIEIFRGIKLDRHLFGTIGEGKINVLGTDEQARDQFSRLVYGGKVSLFIGLVGVAISFPIGMLIGGISGYFGGWLDAILMRISEVLMTIPSIYLLVALSAVLLRIELTNTQRFFLIILITSFISWSGLARVIRGQVLSLKEQEYIQAAKVVGANPFYIIVRHILPQTASYIIISATLSVPSFIASESVLSLIGLGIQQPDPSWGNLLSLATNASILVLQPWLIWPPALLIVLTVLAFNLLGDGLRDALDPRSLEKK